MAKIPFDSTFRLLVAKVRLFNRHAFLSSEDFVALYLDVNVHSMAALSTFKLAPICLDSSQMSSLQ